VATRLCPAGADNFCRFICEITIVDWMSRVANCSSAPASGTEK